MIRLTIGISLLILLSACAPKLTQEGAVIRMIDVREPHNCRSISVVTGYYDAEGAMNEVRNKAAEAGGDTLKILSIDSSLDTTTVVGEALKCE